MEENRSQIEPTKHKKMQNQQERQQSVLFLDVMDVNYTLKTFMSGGNQPLGGTQSAVCYLIEELAKQNYPKMKIFLATRGVTRLETIIMFSGDSRITVTQIPLQLLLSSHDDDQHSQEDAQCSIFLKYLQQIDVIISVNSYTAAKNVSKNLNKAAAAADKKNIKRRRLITWTHCNANDANLAHAVFGSEEIWFVSNWQRDSFLKLYSKELLASKTESESESESKSESEFKSKSRPFSLKVLGNAVSPFMLSSPQRQQQQQPCQNCKTVLFASAPIKGLEFVIREIWPRVVSKCSQKNHLVNLNVYSTQNLHSGKVSDSFSLSSSQSSFNGFLTPSVSLHPSVSQKQLAKILDETDVLIIPGIYPETFCTLAMEAIARGCHVVGGRTGAMHEVYSSFADTSASENSLVHLVDIQDNYDSVEIIADKLAEKIVDVLFPTCEDPSTTSIKKTADTKKDHDSEPITIPTWNERAQTVTSWLKMN